MLPRFHLSDISTVGHHIGTLIVLTGILMLVPCAIALLFGEFSSAVDFVFGIGSCLFVGSLLRLLKARRVDRRCSLLLTGFSWIAVGLMAAIPMFLSGDYASFVDALFDAMSSVTTTGASLAGDLDSMSYSQVVWHAILTLAGGQAVLIIAVYMGFFGEGSFAAVATTRGYSDLISSDFARSSRIIWIVTGAIAGLGTIVAFCIGLFIGLAPADAIVDAFCLAANAANTGGFVPHTSSLIYYHCWGIDATVLLMLLLGAISLGIFTLAMKGKFREIWRNSEFRALAIWMAVFVVFIATGMMHDAIYTTLSGLTDRGMFMAVAAVTTSGMQTIYPEQFSTCLSDGVLILLMLATFIGASACSTGGGVKILHVMEVLRWFGYSIFKAILPENARIPIRYYYFGQRNMTPVDATRAMTIMILYLAFAALGAMAFIAHGNDALASVFESISYVCNSGVGVGVMQPGAPLDLKLVAIAQMWGGRLEFIALIAALAGIVISLRPLPANAGGGRAGARAFKSGRTDTPWHRLKRSRADKGLERNTGSRSKKGFAHRVALVAIASCACLALVFSQAGASAHARGPADANSSGAAASADQVEILQTQSAESYREIEIGDLLSAGERLDERRVQITGNVYGAPLRANGSKLWVNVKSGSKMIGVVLSRSQVEKIETYGSYLQTGDTVQIKGIYHRTCVKHHGELDLHGIELTVIEPSSAVEHPVRLSFLWAGLALALLGFIAMAVKRLLYGKSRRKRIFIFGG